MLDIIYHNENYLENTELMCFFIPLINCVLLQPFYHYGPKEEKGQNVTLQGMLRCKSSTFQPKRESLGNVSV